MSRRGRRRRRRRRRQLLRTLDLDLPRGHRVRSVNRLAAAGSRPRDRELRSRHPPARQAELLDVIREAYAFGGRNVDGRPYTLSDMRCDLRHVLAGELPERCTTWPYAAPDRRAR